MPSEPLHRVQEDLTVVRAALGTELPYDRSHLGMYLIGFGLGVLLIILALFGQEAYVRPVVGGYVTLMLLAWAVQIHYLRTHRDMAPARWRWGRREAAASVAAILLLVGYVVWVATLARTHGQWGPRNAFALGSAIFFFLGVAGCAWVVTDFRRWHLLGTSAALLLAGLAMPVCVTQNQFYLVLGAMCASGGLAAGLLLWWQLRQREAGHAD
jgi:hypothetical protein